MKEAIHKIIHIIGIYVCKVQKQALITRGARNQNKG